MNHLRLTDRIRDLADALHQTACEAEEERRGVYREYDADRWDDPEMLRFDEESKPYQLMRRP